MNGQITNYIIRIEIVRETNMLYMLTQTVPFMYLHNKERSKLRHEIHNMLCRTQVVK